MRHKISPSRDSTNSRSHASFRCGVHLKTAGTTWLEELIGLAKAGGAGLALAQEIYEIYIEAFDHRVELCAPYVNQTQVTLFGERKPNADYDRR